MEASLLVELIPLWILLSLLVLFTLFVLLARVRGGRYVRPIVAGLAKVPLLKRLLTKASEAALERQNPELASAVKKLQRFGNLSDPRQAQKALSSLTAAERRAYLAATGEQQEAEPQQLNREQRRRLEKAQREAQRRR